MRNCRFEIKNVLLFYFRFNYSLSFREFACVSTKDDSMNELRLAKELDMTATDLKSKVRKINLKLVLLYQLK